VPDSDEAHYGISLCCVKDGDSHRALYHINEAIKTIKEPKKFKKEKIHLTYIRAICLKLVKDYPESKNSYVAMSRSFNL
jgi:hypothetical protein